MLDRKAHDVLPGFSAASKSDYQLERYSHDTNSFTESNTNCWYLFHFSPYAFVTAPALEQ
uniref:Uncharacterized protein n=1 Tax=Solanum tuberosum TaxID=4113 RepID=M1C9W5_SOLTU